MGKKTERINRDRMLDQRLQQLDQLQKKNEELEKKLDRAFAYLPKPVQDNIDAGSSEPVHNEEATVAFLDLVDSTRLGQEYKQKGLANEFNDVRTQLFTEIDKIAETYNAQVISSAGDALLWIFTGEGKEERAVRFGTAITRMQREQFSEVPIANGSGVYSLNLAIRLGISTGVIEKGDHQLGNFTKYDVIGSSVNMAARLESNSPHGHFLVDETTKQALPDNFHFKNFEIPAKGITTNGKENTALAYQLIKESGNTQYIGLRAINTFVGRTEELATLESKLDVKLAVVGEEGIGKTKLIDELLTRHSLITLRASPIERRPFLPFVHYFQHQFPNVDALTTTLKEKDLEEHISGFEKLLGYVPADGKQANEEIKAALAAYFNETIIIDNAQWLDSQSKSALQMFSNYIIVSREEEEAEETIHLKPLSEEEQQELFDQLFDSYFKDQPQKERLWQAVKRAGGNPLYIQSTVEDAWNAFKQTGKIPEEFETETIERKLVHNYEAQPEYLKESLRVIGLLGPEFDIEIVKYVAGDVPLGELLTKGLITFKGSYSLRVPSMAKVIEKSMLAKDRQALHAKIAEAYGRLGGSHELLAWHYERANEIEEAIKHWELAADDDMTVYGREEAAEKLEHVLELLEGKKFKDNEERKEFVLKQVEEGEIDERDVRRRTKLVKKIGDTRTVLHPWFKQRVALQEIYVEVLRKLQDNYYAEESLLSRIRGILYRSKGDLEKALQSTKEAYQHDQHSGSKKQTYAIINNFLALSTKRFKETKDYSFLEKAIKLAETPLDGDPTEFEQSTIKFNQQTISNLIKARGGPLDEKYVQTTISTLENWIEQLQPENRDIARGLIYQSFITYYMEGLDYTPSAAHILLPQIEKIAGVERSEEMKKRRGREYIATTFIQGCGFLHAIIGNKKEAAHYLKQIKDKPDGWGGTYADDVAWICEKYRITLEE